MESHGITPMRIAWATDIHFDKCGRVARQRWVESVISMAPDFLILTGDISHNRRILDDLTWVKEQVAPLQVRFVLGNHDVWGPSCQEDRALEDVRDEVRGLLASLDSNKLVYVHDVEPVDRECEIPGHAGFAMIGVDGWWDYRAGIEYNKRISGTAYRGSVAQANAAKNARRADLDTWKLRERIDAVIHRGATDVMILTHVPPYVEACLHNGRLTEPHLIQNFSNLGLGTMLSEKASQHRKIRFTVLCGHTHDDAFLVAAPNLRVFVQGAVHGAPACQLVTADPLTRETSVKRNGGIWYEQDAVTIQRADT